MMTNTAFKLEDAGFDRAQINALTEHWEGSVATKADIANLRVEIKGLNGKIEKTATELRGEMKELRGELKTDISDLRGDMLKYIIGLFFAQAGLLFAGLKFFAAGGG